MTGLATRPSEIVFQPIGKSTGINADGALRGHVADAHTAAVEATLGQGVEELAIGRTTGEHLAVLPGDELPPIATLELGVRDCFDHHTRTSHQLEYSTVGLRRQNALRKTEALLLVPG